MINIKDIQRLIMNPKRVDLAIDLFRSDFSSFNKYRTIPTLKNKKQITLVEFISPNVKGPLSGAYLPVKGPKIIAFSPMNRQIPMV